MKVLTALFSDFFIGKIFVLGNRVEDLMLLTQTGIILLMHKLFFVIQYVFPPIFCLLKQIYVLFGLFPQFGTYFPDLFSPLDVIFTYQTGFYLNFARNPDNPLAKFIQKSCRFRDSSSLVMARMIDITLLPIV